MMIRWNVKCWTCGLQAKTPMLVATHEGGTLDSKDMPDDFKPIVWRLTHQTDECIPVQKNDNLTAAMPQTVVAWMQMTIRLLDMKGEWFLFKMSNWRYVLDCAQENQGEGYYQGLNEYKNPKPQRRKSIDPETELPPDRALRKVRRPAIKQRPVVIRRRKIAK